MIPIKAINSNLSFAVNIVLLKDLGITEIKFRKGYAKLSIFKDV